MDIYTFPSNSKHKSYTWYSLWIPRTIKQVKKQSSFVSEIILFSYLDVCGIYSLYDQQAYVELQTKS